MSINPEKITSSEFSQSGVTITVENAKPGDDITVAVRQAQGKVKTFTQKAKVGQNGQASVGVKAKSAPVLGEYIVKVTGAGIQDDGTFDVVRTRSGDNGNAGANDGSAGGGSDAGSNGAGSDGGSNGAGSSTGSDSSSSSSPLPRTGTEMTGLALGAGLLVVGAAAVVITRRRANSQDPADY